MRKGAGRRGNSGQRSGVPSPASADPQGSAELDVLPPDELRERLSKRLDPDLMRQLDVQMMRMSMWRSDWPPADCLEGYTSEERAVIMGAVQARTTGAINRDAMVAERTQRRMDRGQIIGLIIALAGIVGGTLIALDAKEWWSAAIGVSMVLGGIGGPSVARLIADRYYLQGISQKSPGSRQ